MQHRPEIDGLRAVAVLSVILYHAGLTRLSGGFAGVDIFFVISGYLITSIIYEELQQGTFSLANFYERRVRRILPALAFVLVATLPLAWYWLLPRELEQYGKSLVAVALFLSNVLFARSSDYFAPDTDTLPLLHTWSLAVEEQYYVLFPLLIMLAWRFDRRKQFALLAVITTLSLGYAEWAVRGTPIDNYYLLGSRAWELLIGAMTGLYLARQPLPPAGALSQAGGLAGLALIAYAFVGLNGQTPFPGVFALFPTAGAALVILFATPGTLAGTLLGLRPLVGIGLISYSAYLWHHPLFAFTRHARPGEDSIGFMLALVPVILGLAWFSWRFVEQPFRNRRWLNRRRVFTLAGAVSAGFIAIGMAGQDETVLAHSRFDDSGILSLQATDTKLRQQMNTCFLTRASDAHFDEARCLIPSKPGVKRVLLIGDSHAASLYPGLHKALLRHGVQLDMLSASYCLPLVTRFPENDTRTATPRCTRINQRIQELLRKSPYDLVVLSAYHLNWSFGNNPKWTYKGYYADLLQALSKLATTQQILVVGNFPVWKENLPDVLARELTLASSSDPNHLPVLSENDLSQGLFDADQRMALDVPKAGGDHVSVVSTLCSEGRCPRFVETPTGRRLFSNDYGHLGGEASDLVAERVVAPRVLARLGLDRTSLTSIPTAK